MDILVAIDKLRCPLPNSFGQESRCSTAPVLQVLLHNEWNVRTQEGGWLEVGWLGWPREALSSRPKHASNQHSCMKETKREISGRSSAMGINRLSPWDPRVLESLIFDFSMGWSNTDDELWRRRPDMRPLGSTSSGSFLLWLSVGRRPLAPLRLLIYFGYGQRR